MTLLTIIGLLILLQVVAGTALGLWFSYLALRGPHAERTHRRRRATQNG